MHSQRCTAAFSSLIDTAPPCQSCQMRICVFVCFPCAAATTAPRDSSQQFPPQIDLCSFVQAISRCQAPLLKFPFRLFSEHSQMPQDPFGVLELIPLHSGLFLKAHHSPNHLVKERDNRGAANLGLFRCWE